MGISAVVRFSELIQVGCLGQLLAYRKLPVLAAVSTEMTPCHLTRLVLLLMLRGQQSAREQPILLTLVLSYSFGDRSILGLLCCLP